MIPATFENSIAVFDNLRREDSMEISRLGKPTEVLTELLETSHAWLALLDSVPVAVYGIRPSGSPLQPAVLWLVTTRVVESAKIQLAKASARFVYSALAEWGVLEGWVLCENERSQRWLTWMGFTLSEPFELEPVGLVRKFQMRL